MTNSTSTTTTRHIGSPYRQVTTTYQADPLSPVRSTIVSQSPVRRVSTVYHDTHSPVTQTLVEDGPIGLTTSSYVGYNGSTTIVNDVDVRSRVNMMLEHTRARLGTSRVIGETLVDPYVSRTYSQYL